MCHPIPCDPLLLSCLFSSKEHYLFIYLFSWGGNNLFLALLASQKSNMVHNYFSDQLYFIPTVHILLPYVGKSQCYQNVNHLKRLSFLSISCNVFSAGLMICLKTWIKPFLPSLLPLTMHEFSTHTAWLKEKWDT